ncbi:MAG: PhoH family protein [Thermoanaerobaculia bacterium]|nr:PhoH family protein [Thermoanaerobaculia bacterium]
MSSISLADEGLESLFGIRDQNLKRIEKAFGVQLSARGADLRIEGSAEAVAAVERLMSELTTLADSGFRFRPEDVRTAIRVAQQAPEVSLIDFFQPSDPTMSALRRFITPRSFNQHRYLQAMMEHDIVISVGPAGTGKTFMAVAMAAAALQEQKVRRIVLARPAVEAGEKLGFLPGDLAEKVNPYLRPLYDSLYDILGYDKVGRLLERGIIEVAPIAFMRGRTLNDAFVILDEAQNTTSEQMKMFLTRIGFNSKAVINGDVTQIDLPSNRASGLRQALQILRGVRGISFIHFERADVVRHPLVQKIVAAYEKHELEHEKLEKQREQLEASEKAAGGGEEGATSTTDRDSEAAAVS